MMEVGDCQKELTVRIGKLATGEGRCQDQGSEFMNRLGRIR